MIITITCPYCGEKMELQEQSPFSIYDNGSWKHYKRINYRCRCGSQSPIEETIEDATESARSLNGI